MDKGNLGESGKAAFPSLQGLPFVPGKEEAIHVDRMDGQGARNRSGHKQNFLGVML